MFTMTHSIQTLIKGDADAFYFFQLNQKEYAFKVLQERVYPAIQLLQSQGIQIPHLISTKAGQ